MAIRKISSLAVSVLNQAIGSGVGFLTGVYFSLVLSADQFGYWGIGFATILFAGGIGNAIFLTQMVVNAPEVAKDEREKYYVQIFNLLLLFLSRGLFAVIVVCVALCIFDFEIKEQLFFVFLVAVSSVGNILKDYFVRRAYIKRIEKMALVINLAGAAVFIVCVCVSYFYKLVQSEIDAMIMYGAIQFSSAFVGYYFFNKEVAQATKSVSSFDLREILVNAKWSVFGTVVTWVQSQAYVYGTAILIGVAGVGLANAARVFTSPYIFLLPAINQLTMPRLSEMRVVNPGAIVRKGLVYTGLLVLFGFCYSAIILVFSEDFVGLLYGVKYEGIGSVVVAWCFVLIAQLIRDGASTLMQSLKLFRFLAMYNVATAIICLMLTVFLSVKFEVVGSVVALGMGEFILGIGLWIRINRYKKLK